jgi:CBS domain-containing protein
MSIKDICGRQVVTATKDASVNEVAKLMKKHNVGNVVIIDNQVTTNKPIGILTDRDITMKIVAEDVDARQISAGDIMTENLLLLHGNQSINEAIDMMCAKGVRRAPISDDTHKIIGIASIDDLFILLAEEMGSLSKLIRKQVDAVKK